MKQIKNIIITAVCFMFLLPACNKDKATDYQKYLSYGQGTYPAKAPNLVAYGGLYRLLVTWGPQVDQTVVKYVVYWDNGSGNKDSIVYNQPSGKTGKDSVYINNLLETSAYTITVYAYNAAGLRSVPAVLSNAVAYGSIFSSGLKNRKVLGDNYFYNGNDTAYINNWGASVPSEAVTRVRYTDKSGVTQTILVSPTQTLAKAIHVDTTTKLYIQSGVYPINGSPDTIYASNVDTFTVNYNVAGNYTVTGSQTVYNYALTSNSGSFPFSLSKIITKLSPGVYSINIIADNGAYFSSNWQSSTVFTATINSDFTVSLSGSASGPITVTSGGSPSTFDKTTNTFNLNYGLTISTSYKDKYAVETLVRNP